MTRWAARLLIVLSLCLGAGCGLFGIAPVPPFYDPPVPLEPGKPGEIIRTETMDTPDGVNGWRALYHSTDLNDRDIVVSGAFFAPDEPPPAGGFPVLAVAHGTTGIARGCAPSIDPFKSLPGLDSFYDMFVEPFVAAGYAVALTDYQGMGAPGPYSYLIGSVQARGVLDSVRAMRNFPGIETAPETMVMGHSQGGQAAAFTAQLQSEYAKDVPLSGALLFAPAVELGPLITRVFENPQIGPATGLVLMVARAWPEQYPELKDSAAVRPNVDFSPVETECVFGAVLRTLAVPTAYMSTSPLADPAWAKRIEENTPNAARLTLPVWVAQGMRDEIVFPATTEAFVNALCAEGQPVRYTAYAGAGHLDLPKFANPDALTWMGEVFAGRPPPGTC
jgi:pimeloyl-ACP methyl ester carboxylesterase